MDAEEVVLNIDWAVWAVVITDTLEGLLEESSGKLNLGVGGELGSVEPSRNWVNLEEGVEAGLNGLFRDEDSDITGVATVVWHLWEGWGDLWEIRVVEDSSGTNHNAISIHDGSVMGLEVHEPFWHELDGSVGIGDHLVDHRWHLVDKLVSDLVDDSVTDVIFEDVLEHIDEAIPEGS